MFKNIQKKILLKYPLLWNTKFIPMLLVGIFMHILFFGLGYIDGTIDFSDKNNIDIQVISILFGVLFIIIIIILWLINYFKNNSLKSFYSKSSNSLFYEWLQIFVISFLLITFYIPFSIGKQLHQKSYYSYDDTTNRCKTIAAASIFIDGSFASTEIDSLASGLIDSLGNNIRRNDEYESSDYAVESADNVVENLDSGVEPYQEMVFKDYIIFNSKKYDEYSLLNRNTFEFSIVSREKDSINKLKVENWLVTENYSEVKNLMNSYLKLIKEHNLATNLTLNKWFEITYKAPNFNEFLYIRPYLNEFEASNSYRYNNYETAVAVSTEEMKYSKYYIQQDILKDKYDIVSEAHTTSFINFEMLLSFLYGAFGLTILIFSFRITSGKSWLIALVFTGIINIIFGIFTAITGITNLYFYLILFTILAIIFYFFFIYFNKESLKFSRIALNLFLWSLIGIIPIIYFMLQEYYAKVKYYNETYNSLEYLWFRDHVIDMLSINFIVALVSLFFLSKIIRNWKGISED